MFLASKSAAYDLWYTSRMRSGAISNTILEHLYSILCDLSAWSGAPWKLASGTKKNIKYKKIWLWLMNLSCMPEFLISDRASVASEKILEKMRGKSYRPMEMECNNPSYVRLQFDVHNQEIQKRNSTLWPWAYFTNGPNAAASIAPTLIRHCLDLPGKIEKFTCKTCRRLPDVQLCRGRNGN